MSFRSSRLGLALLLVASISCNDTVTGPAAIAPEGAIVLGDSVLTRGALVRASIAAPVGYTVVPGSVAWTVSGGTAPVSAGTAAIIGVGGTQDSVDIPLSSEGSLQLTARYKLRGNIGAGSSVTIVGPSSRSNGDLQVQSTRDVQVASPILEYEILPPASVTAGVPFGEVRVSFKDVLGRVLAGATDSVVITLDPSSGTSGASLLGPVRAKAVAGVATFSGKSIQRAGVGYRLIASSPTVASRDTARTTVVAAAASASQSSLTVRDTLLAVGAGTTVTVTLRDPYGNPVLAATPAAFVPSGSAGILAAFTCVNGVCTATYTAPTAPGTPILTATVGGTVITGAPRPVSVRAGTATRLKITGDTTQVAGNTNLIVITAFDAFANVASGYAGPKRLTFSGASLSPIGTAPKIAATNVQSTVDLTFEAGVARVVSSVLVKAERAVLAATDGTISATGDDRLPVRVVANAPDAVQSTIVVADSARFGGQTTTVTISLRDAYGNPVLTGTADAFAPTVSGGTLSSFTCVDGVCTATYTAPPANGPQTVTATIGGTPVAPVGTTTVQVTFDNTAPTITGPTGGAGAAASTKSVPENTIAVHTFTVNEPVTWSLAGDDAARFAIDPATGALVFVTAPDFERPADLNEDNGYVITVTATDAAGNVSTQVLTVTITNVDEIAPRITGPTGAAGDAISAKDVPENTAPVHRFLATEEVTWSIEGGVDAAAFTINAVTGALVFRTAPNFEAPSDTDANNRYVVIVAATDPSGNVGRQTVTVTVTDVDEVPPVVTGPTGGAGAPTSTKTLPENVSAVHTFTANEPVTWSVSGGADAARFAIDPMTGALRFLVAPDFENPTDADDNNTYVVIVKAVDAGGNEVTQTLTITITNIDETLPGILGPSGAPGDPSSVKSIPEGTTAVHTFTANEDAEWGLDGGPDAAAFVINPFSGVLSLRTAPDFEVPTDADANNTYIVVISAVDPAGNISRQTLTVTVTDVDEIRPLITGPSGAAGDAATVTSVPENRTAVHTFAANEPVTWSVDGGADAARFTIDPLTGALTFVAAPDFETPTDADGNNTYVVTIKAVDAVGNVSTQTVTITVTDADEVAPTITGPSGAAGDAVTIKSVPENTTPVHTFTANEPVTWAVAGGADAARFTIDPATGALSFATAPDFEAPNDSDGNNTYVVTVRATDAAGNVSTQTLTVTVTNLDEVAPAITGPSGAAGAAASSKSIPENTSAVHTFTASKPVTWSLDGGADVARFTIDPATGALSFVAAPDFETPRDADLNNTYVVVVKAVDASGNISTQTVTVTVTNVDEIPPSITGPSGGAGAATSTKSINENIAPVHVFTASEDVTWGLDGGEDAGVFSINAATGALVFQSARDFENPTDGATSGSNTYIVVVKATDSAGNVSRQTVTVTILDVDDTAPEIVGPGGVAGAATSATSVPEGTAAVHTFAASEPVTWTIDGGADAAKVSINATTGALVFTAPLPAFLTPGDADGNNTYIVTVKATDAAGLVSTQTLTVTVTQLDVTAPIITGPSGGAGALTSANSVPENSTLVHTFSANEAVTWAIVGGDDQAKFGINATGTLSFLSAPNFEAPTDVGANNTYIVQIRATDASGNTATQTVTVTVTDVNESGLLLTPSAQDVVAVNEVTERIIFYVRLGGVRTAVTSSTVFNLTASGGGTFFSDVNGTATVTARTVAAGVDSFFVYYRQATGAGTTTTLSATRASGDVVGTGTKAIAVVAQAPAAERLSGIICTATTGNSNSATLAASTACTATAGQLLVMILSHSPTANPYDMPAFGTPTGWTKLREEYVGTAANPKQLRTYIFYRVAPTTGDYAVTFNLAALDKVRSTYLIAAVNQPNSTPVDIDAVSSTLTPTAGISIPSASATRDGSILLAYAVQDIGSNSYVAPAGLSTVGVAGNGGQAVTMILFSKDRQFSGPTRTFTVGTAQTANPSTGGVIILGPKP